MIDDASAVQVGISNWQCSNDYPGYYDDSVHYSNTGAVSYTFVGATAGLVISS